MNTDNEFDASFDEWLQCYRNSPCSEDRRNAIEKIMDTNPSFEQLISACKRDCINGSIQQVAIKMLTSVNPEDLSLAQWLVGCLLNSGYPSELQSIALKKLNVKNVSFKEWLSEYIRLEPRNNLKEYLEEKLLSTAKTDDDLREICNNSEPYTKLYRLAFAQLPNQLPRSFCDLLTDYYSATGKLKKEYFEELSKADESVDCWIDTYNGRRLADSKFEILCLRKILEKSLTPDQWQKIL